jgi:nitroreductase
MVAFPNPGVGGPLVDFEDVVRRRRMVRHYTDEPVSVGDVEKLITAVLRAPSAGFTQGCRFLVLVEAADRRRFWSVSRYVPPDERRAQVAGWLEQAPLVIVVLCSKAAYLARYSEPDKAWVPNDETDWEGPYWYVDAAFASMLVLLEAVNLGMGAMFMGVTAEFVPPFRTEFGVPEEFQPIGSVLVGHRHPDVGPNYRSDRRKPREQVVYYGDWGRSSS